MKIKVAGYIRVSTAEQVAYGLSLQAQRDLLTRYAEEHDMELVEIYADEGISAAKSLEKRTEILRLVSDAEKGRFEVILFKDITRWSRNSSQYYRIQDRLDKCKVGWIAVEQPYLETVTPTGKFQVSVMLGTSQLEADQTSQRIKSVQDAEVRRGYFPFPSHCAPTGYTTMKIDGHNRLVPDNDKRDLIVALFEEFIRTGNATQMARNLGYRHENLLRTLRNRVYIGEFRGIKGFCEPIVSEELFNQAQSLMKHHSYTPKKHLYIFSGLTYCGICGEKMRWNSPNDRYPMCRCLKHQNTITEKEMERQVIAQVEPELNRYRITLKDRNLTKEKNLKKRFEEKLKRTTDLYIDGIIDKEEFTKRREEYQSAIDAIEIPVVPKMPLSWKKMYFELTNSQKNVLWKSTVDHFEIKDKTVYIAFESAKVLAERIAMNLTSSEAQNTDLTDI